MDDPTGPLPESAELLELLAMDPAKLPPSLRPLVEELRRLYGLQQPDPPQPGPPPAPD